MATVWDDRQSDTLVAWASSCVKRRVVALGYDRRPVRAGVRGARRRGGRV